MAIPTVMVILVQTAYTVAVVVVAPGPRPGVLLQVEQTHIAFPGGEAIKQGTIAGIVGFVLIPPGA